MASLLEKKMASNSRLPPSLLTYMDFWDELDALVSEWVLESFSLECEVEIDVRKNIDAKEASDVMNGPTAYLVCDGGEPIPAGIILSDSLMTRYAAMRLSEDPDRLDGTSPVFLQLLCEEVSKDLLVRLSKWMAASSDVMPASDPSYISLTSTPLNKNNRYMLVVANITVMEETFAISFIVEMENMLELHRAKLRKLREGLTGGGASNPALRRSVRRSMLDLEVVIDKIDMTVAECYRMEVGSEIPLLNGDRSTLNLIAKTIRGDENIAQGELGAWKNFRALKLSTPVSDGFLRNMVEL